MKKLMIPITVIVMLISVFNITTVTKSIQGNGSLSLNGLFKVAQAAGECSPYTIEESYDIYRVHYENVGEVHTGGTFIEGNCTCNWEESYPECCNDFARQYIFTCEGSYSYVARCN